MTIINTRVLSIEPLSPYVLKVMLEAPQAISFKAGQYLQVVMSDQDKRPFSIASMPNDDGLIELHIGATPENPYAYEVVELARNTQELRVEVGLGNAYLRESDLPAVLIAGGTGYSYAKSILFDCLRQQPNRQVYLFWGAKTAADLYEADMLAKLANIHEQFEFIPVLEAPESDWLGKTGLVHEVVMQTFPAMPNLQIYAAGRFEMAAVIKDAFLPLDLVPENLFGDAFAFLK
jgi:aquacobalamin reductase/NAD(P)H-flavin reductase